jgi:serine/threonine protein kinase
MEHCGLYNLKVYVKERVKLTEDQAKPIFVSLAKALRYLHGKSIVHRDIKLENVLIKDDGTVKLIDFGFSEQLESDEEQLFTYCG